MERRAKKETSAPIHRYTKSLCKKNHWHQHTIYGHRCDIEVCVPMCAVHTTLLEIWARISFCRHSETFANVRASFSIFFFSPYRAIQPQCLGSLVMYFSQPKENAASEKAAENPDLVYLYAVGIILCSILTISFSHPFMVYALQMGMRVRITCCSLIYRKVSSRCIL